MSCEAAGFVNNKSAHKYNERAQYRLYVYVIFLCCVMGCSFSVLMEYLRALTLCYFCTVVILLFNYKNQSKVVLIIISHLDVAFCLFSNSWKKILHILQRLQVMGEYFCIHSGSFLVKFRILFVVWYVVMDKKCIVLALKDILEHHRQKKFFSVVMEKNGTAYSPINNRLKIRSCLYINSGNFFQ